MRWSLLLVSLLVPSVARAADYVDDPLTAATFTGRGAQGGAFGSGGWTTTSETDAVWYEIADALPTARIEYDLSGMSVGGTLKGADHDILCVYQAAGGAEPIDYGPFRNNDMKLFTRVFGTAEPGRGGAIKAELHVCPRGEPWHHDTPCDDACYTGGLAYANGMDKDIGWDASKTYRMFVAWGAGKLSFGRDGAELASIAYKGEYAPQPLRVRFGSPRHKLGSVEAMPVGITIKNVKITGTSGARTPICAPPDAGTMEDTSVDSASADTAIEPSDTGMTTSDAAFDSARPPSDSAPADVDNAIESTDLEGSCSYGARRTAAWPVLVLLTVFARRRRGSAR